MSKLVKKKTDFWNVMVRKRVFYSVDKRMTMKIFKFLTAMTFLLFFINSCQNQSVKEQENVQVPLAVVVQEVTPLLIQVEGQTIKERFNPPSAYERVESANNTFASYLQNLPLKPEGTEVKYYNGETKYNRDVYSAVVDIDVGARDLQQCADAIMRLRAEYLWAQEAYDDIHFNFTNGFRVDYGKWREGYRMKVQGNKTNWYKAGASDSSYLSFRKYMDLIFTYAGTWSLSQELTRVDKADMQIGDVFIKGGSPGHAVIVVDKAVDPATKKKVFLLAQSYMPAQDIQILQNPNNKYLNPWYDLDFGETLYTPEWTFSAKDLKRFP